MQIKRILVCAAAAAALAVPAGALAASQTYRGTVDDDPKATVSLKIRTAEGARFFKAFTVHELEVSCAGGASGRIDSASVTGIQPVDDRGRFIVRTEDDRQTFKLRAKLKGEKASGTLRYVGRTEIEGRTRDCESGRVEWSASR